MTQNPYQNGELILSSAFSETADGGNPAGVWIGDRLPDPGTMQEIAREVGFSETAFNVPNRAGHWTTLYYSPEAEVSFCGHATIATGVALGERFGSGSYVLETAAGTVPVDVEEHDGRFVATLTSVAPQHRDLPGALLNSVLGTLGWDTDVLGSDVPPGLAYAGAWHVILQIAQRSTLSKLEYDFDALKQIMLENDLTTIQLIYQISDYEFDARDPFPVGGVVEDPATGAAAAALGAHLRLHNLVVPPADVTINQGHDMGRPSLLQVHIPPSGGIEVSGTAVPLS